MTIAAPHMFWLLPALALPLVGFFWWAWRRRQQLVTQFISARLLTNLKVGVSTARQKARMAMIVAAVVFLIFALARPQWGVTQEEARVRGLDIIAAIDVSNSMLAGDVPPNRLQRAKLAALDLAHRAKTDRLGLVAFAGTAFLQCPLTLDDAAFSQSVDSLDTRTLSQGGTAIGEAINEARKAFKKASDNHKVLVLFTDGEDHDSEALPAAEQAATEGMLIFTVGIGTPEGEDLRIRDARGRLEPIRDEKGQQVKSRLNEELLQDISRATKGFYMRLRDTRTMELLYDRGIAPLPKTEGAVKLFERYHERFYWPLGIAMALLILEMFFPERKRRRSAKSASAAPGSRSLTETAAVLLLLSMPFAASAGGAGSALREYNEGNYQDALKGYNRLIERKKDDPRLHFNAGAAAYQSRRLDEAATQFKEALASPDLELQQQSYYNLGNTLFRIGEQVPDPAKKKEAWETSLKQFDSALKLNKLDLDAKFNREFVEKQLEELKKQQQDQDKNDDQKKDDQKKQDENKQDQKNQDQNKDDQNKQDESQKQDQNQDSQAQNKQGQDQKQDEKKQNDSQDQAKNQQDQKKDDSKQNPRPGESKEKSAEDAAREAAMMAAGQMTPQQALQLLDAQKDDEQVLRLAPPGKQPAPNRPFKNW